MEKDEELFVTGDKIDEIVQGPLIMTKSKHPFDWFDQKYGEDVRPYEAWITFKQQPSKKINQTKKKIEQNRSKFNNFTLRKTIDAEKNYFLHSY